MLKCYIDLCVSLCVNGFKQHIYLFVCLCAFKYVYTNNLSANFKTECYFKKHLHSRYTNV